MYRGNCKTHLPDKATLLWPFVLTLFERPLGAVSSELTVAAAAARKWSQNHRIFQTKQFCHCLYKSVGFLFLFAFFFTLRAENPAVYLDGRLPETNGRYKTFYEALRLMSERGVKTIVETGTERWLEAKNSFDGDGGSTIIFSHWAFNNKAQMYSVDINQNHIAYSRDNTFAYKSNLTLVLQDSVEFLKYFPNRIDFLYLDSYDTNEYDPGPSQEHCLKEVLAAEDKLTKSSIVMIDDCNVKGGGKGKLAIEYLLSKGWVLHRNFHQVILLKGDKK